MNPVCILVKYNSLVKKKKKCVSLTFYKYGENVAKEIQYIIKPYSRLNFQKYMNLNVLNLIFMSSDLLQHSVVCDE